MSKPFTGSPAPRENCSPWIMGGCSQFWSKIENKPLMNEHTSNCGPCLTTFQNESDPLSSFSGSYKLKQQLNSKLHKRKIKFELVCDKQWQFWSAKIGLGRFAVTNGLFYSKTISDQKFWSTIISKLSFKIVMVSPPLASTLSLKPCRHPCLSKFLKFVVHGPCSCLLKLDFVSSSISTVDQYSPGLCIMNIDIRN